MSPDSIQISVVVPVYNSAVSLMELVDRTSTVLTSMNVKWEIVMVLDGSPDNSWDVLLEIEKKYPGKIQLIRLMRNFGQNGATFCGLAECKGKIAITIDDDLQLPPEEISTLWNAYQESGADVIYGKYNRRAHSWFRRVGSRFVKGTVRKITGGVEIGNSFRLIGDKLLPAIVQHAHDPVLIDQVISWYTIDPVMVEVEHHPRAEGKSGYSLWKLFVLSIKVFFQYSDIALRLISITGLSVLFLSSALGIYFIWRKLILDAPPGYSSLIVSIMFSTGLIMFTLGIVGIYLRRIYTGNTRKPVYSIREKR